MSGPVKLVMPPELSSIAEERSFDMLNNISTSTGEARSTTTGNGSQIRSVRTRRGPMSLGSPENSLTSRERVSWGKNTHCYISELTTCQWERFCKFTIAMDFRSTHRKCLEGNFVLSLARSTVSSIPASMQAPLAALAGSFFCRLQLWASTNLCLWLR